MTQESLFVVVRRQMLLRLVVLIAFVIIAAMVTLAEFQQGEHPYHIGSKPLVYDDGAGYVLGQANHKRLEVLSSDLEDGRGIALLSCGAGGTGCLRSVSPCDSQIVIADAWDAMSAFCLPPPATLSSHTSSTGIAGRAEEALHHVVTLFRGQHHHDVRFASAGARWFLVPSTRKPICPEASCIPVEHGGLAKTTRGVLLAETHRARLTLFEFGTTLGQESSGSQTAPGSPPPTLAHLGQGEERMYDVAVGAGDQFLISTAVEGTAAVQASEPQGSLWLGSAAPSTAAATPGAATPAPVPLKLRISDLSRPLGVAFSSKPNRVYVADASHDVMRWSYYESSGADWRRHTFWSLRRQGDEAWPRLQHMVAALAPPLGEIVIAGAPDGLYIFHPDAGSLLAKITVGRAVQGLAWAKPGVLLITAGRYLCQLEIEPLQFNAAPITVGSQTSGGAGVAEQVARRP